MSFSRKYWRITRARVSSEEQGSAAIEMALTASVLLLTLIGIMKVCVAVYSYHYVSEAAREGSRYAMVRGYACNTTYLTSACPASQSDIQTYVRGLNYPAITASSVSVSASWAPYPSTVICSPDPVCRNNGNIVTVTVTYPVPITIPFWGTKTWTMTSTSAAVISD